MIDAKNVLLIAVVLVVVVIVGLYIPYVQYERSQDANTAPVGVDSSRTLVVYSNRGFEPEAITIDVGTTVEWRNESDKPLWIASDPHPSHTDLPGFDEGGVEGGDIQGWVSIAYAHSTGSLHRYTFTQIGTWGYHNHLVPSDRGAVVVE